MTVVYRNETGIWHPASQDAAVDDMTIGSSRPIKTRVGCFMRRSQRNLVHPAAASICQRYPRPVGGDMCRTASCNNPGSSRGSSAC